MSSGRQPPISRQPESIARPGRSTTPWPDDRSGSRRDILVVAPDDEHFKRIESALTGSEFVAQWMIDYRSLLHVGRRARSDMVVVAVTAEPITNGPVLAVIDALKQQGHTIV